jgi:hypothetical protein
MSALTVTAIKGCETSDDGLQMTVTFTTKYVGDLNVTMPLSCLEALQAAVVPAKTHKAPEQSENNAAQLRVAVPKTWLVMADTQVHRMVILAFDHQAETKAGYALNPDAAKKLAGVLVQKADDVLTHRTDKTDADR